MGVHEDIKRKGTDPIRNSIRNPTEIVKFLQWNNMLFI